MIPASKSSNITENKFEVKPKIKGDTAEIFAGYCKTLFGTAPEIVSRCAAISFEYDKKLLEEGYGITARDGKVKVVSGGLTGLNHGTAALLQLIEYKEGQWLMPECEITDFPDTEWRGFMVDLSRRWHDFDSLLMYTDMCWLYRINRLHLHFADDQGYRLPSKHFAGITDGHHYSIEQLDILKKYARDRGIMLIPEIEMPGHANYITKPNCGFGSAEDPDHKSIMCLGEQSLFENIRLFISEVCELFPDAPYIHIGGDEAFIDKWEKCEKCREYMAKHSLSNFRQLYAHFIAKATDIVTELGRAPLVWEGFAKEGSEKINKDTVVMVFESLYQTSTELLQSGFRIINASWKPLYIVPWRDDNKNACYGARDVYAWDKYTWSNWWDASRAYEHPIIEPRSEDKNILGGQLCAWEGDLKTELPAVLENLPALAERTWNGERVMSFDEYKELAEKSGELARKLISVYNI